MYIYLFVWMDRYIHTRNDTTITYLPLIKILETRKDFFVYSIIPIMYLHRIKK